MQQTFVKIMAAMFLFIACVISRVYAADAELLTVYKSPTCGCCSVWIEHAKAQGFAIKSHDMDDVGLIKARYKIQPQHQSCHTVISVEGFVFEGHVPAALIDKFLKEKPENAIGLAVPGMPIGSPGMEMGDRFTPYEVLQLNKDGSTVVYQKVTHLHQKF